MKINPAFPSNSEPLIHAISEKPHNTLITRNSVFLIQSSVKRVSKGNNRYYGIRLVQAKDGHYVEYHHRIPHDLTKKVAPELIKKEWLNKKGQLLEWARFRNKGLLNSVPQEEYAEYAAGFIASIKVALQNGYDPFKDLMGAYKEEVLQHAPVMQLTKEKGPVVSFRQAVDLWLKQYPVGSPSRKSYNVIQSLLEDAMGPQFEENVKSITSLDLENMLQEQNEEYEWAKSTYNDKVKKLKTCFMWLSSKKRKIIAEDITEELELKTKVGSSRHTAFDNKMAAHVKDLLLNHEMQPWGLNTYRFCMTVYYTLTRPVKETRQLMCKDINFERGIITIDPLRAKGGQGGKIPMAPELAEMFREMGVDKAPGNYYIFGSEGFPGPKCYKASYFSWFWRVKVRQPNELDKDFTIYSWKHTRVIDLYLSGVVAADIQRMCRHKSATEFETYLRDLGLDLSDDINLKAKKF